MTILKSSSNRSNTNRTRIKTYFNSFAISSGTPKGVASEKSFSFLSNSVLYYTTLYYTVLERTRLIHSRPKRRVRGWFTLFEINTMCAAIPCGTLHSILTKRSVGHYFASTSIAHAQRSSHRPTAILLSSIRQSLLPIDRELGRHGLRNLCSSGRHSFGPPVDLPRSLYSSL